MLPGGGTYECAESGTKAGAKVKRGCLDSAVVLALLSVLLKLADTTQFGLHKSIISHYY